MDYAFAPKVSGKYPALLRRMLEHREVRNAYKTTVVPPPSVVSDVRLFLVYLQNNVPSGQRPIGDLLICSDGNDQGWIDDIQLDSRAPTVLTYGVLKTILSDPERSSRLRIPPALYSKPDGTVTPIQLHVRGCRIGLAPKTVDALKQVLGGVVPITAPKHYHKIAEVRGIGWFEYLSDARFFLFSPTPLARADLLERLQRRHPDYSGQPKLKFLNGEDVPDEMWQYWIDADPRKVYLPLGRTMKNHDQIQPDPEDNALYDSYVWRFNRRFRKISPEPGLRARLMECDDFQLGWGFPIYEQYGYKTPDDFIRGFSWKPQSEAGDIINWVGERYEYHFPIPITDPPPRIERTSTKAHVKYGKLIYNFYPWPGSRLDALPELNVIDTNLFYRTP